MNDDDIARDAAEILGAESSLEAQLLACRAIHKSKNEQIAALIRQVRELAVRADRVVEWIRWEDRRPTKGEAGWVIFRDELNGRTWIQAGTEVQGEWWHYQPLAWQLKPTLPFWAEA